MHAAENPLHCQIFQLHEQLLVSLLLVPVASSDTMHGLMVSVIPIQGQKILPLTIE